MRSEREALDALIKPFVSDVHETLDRDFAIDWVVDDGMWAWSSRGCACTWCEVGDVEDETSGPDRWARLATLVELIADNAFDDVYEPWPRCPQHGDHPLEARARPGSVWWTCRRPDGGPVAELGQLTR